MMIRTMRFAVPAPHVLSLSSPVPSRRMTSVSLCHATGAVPGTRDHKVGIKDFEMLKVLGSGAYGKVFLVRKRSGADQGKLYAMKVLKKASIVQKAKTLEHTKTERQVLESIRSSAFLVTMHYAFQTPTKLHLVLDYVSGGELFTHLYQRDHFSEPEVRIYIAEIILALEQLHKLGIIYRDIKLENILLDSSGHIVLTDFGLSKEFAPQETDRRSYSFCGTIEYMAPEVVRGGSAGHNLSVDWWSVGVLTYELLTGASPFTVEGERNTQAEISRRILRSEPPIPDFMSLTVRDFIHRLLLKDSRKRLGGGPDDANELKRHPFFKDLDWHALGKKQVPAPFIPKISGELDVSNFAEEFTSMLPVDPEVPVVAEWDDDLFRGYSYVGPTSRHIQSPAASCNNNQKDSDKDRRLVSSQTRSSARPKNAVAMTPIRRDQTQNQNQVAAQLKPEASHILAAKFGKSSFFQDYELKARHGFLGDGSFSVCRECVHRRTGVAYAVKIISRRIDSSREISMLRQCHGHPHIVNIIDTRQDDFHTYIIMELLQGGELIERLRRKRFSEHEAGRVFRALLSAVHFMHSKGIVHRDLKPEVCTHLITPRSLL